MPRCRPPPVALLLSASALSALTVLAAGPLPRAEAAIGRPEPIRVPVGAEEPEGAVEREHGGYGAPELKLTSLAGSAALLAGAQGGWIFDRSLVVGGAAYGLVSSAPAPERLPRSAGERPDLSLGYGGLHVGGILWSRSVLHLSFGALAGAGRVSAGGSAPVGATFMVLEPDLELEWNAARHVRIALGGSYRLIPSTDVSAFDSRALSGPAASLAIKLGVF
jgi:hypothetical protein